MTVQENKDPSSTPDGVEVSYDEKEEEKKIEKEDLEAPFVNEKEEGGEKDDDGVEQAEPEEEEKSPSTTYDLPVGDVFCWRKATSVSSFASLTAQWLVVNKAQILSGITVALAQVPEAVSFSFVAGVDPIVGLQSAWIMGICTSLAGGRPGMVAGSTGAVAIVLPKVVEKGIGYMFYAIMLAGIIQIIFSLLRLGKIVRLIPHPVMVGFCNGLGIVIGVAQFNIFKVRPESTGSRKLLETFGAFAPFTNGWDWIDATMGGWMTFHIAITLITYALFPKLTKAIPSSLAAIIVSTILEWAFVRPIGYKTNTVKDLASVAVRMIHHYSSIRKESLFEHIYLFFYLLFGFISQTSKFLFFLSNNFF